MLSLGRRVGERIRVGPDIWIEVLGLYRGTVRLGITAPRSVEIVREELLERRGMPAPPPPSYGRPVAPDLEGD